MTRQHRALPAGAVGLFIVLSASMSAHAGDVGACCLAGGACIETTEADCLAQAGTPQGAGIACADVACPNDCPGDLDGDGVLGFGDLVQMLAAWGPYEPCPPYAPADLDQDCVVGDGDLAILLYDWSGCGLPEGACCFADGTCDETSSTRCSELGGTYQGNFTSCAQNGCVPSDLDFDDPQEFPAFAAPIIEAPADFDLDGDEDVAAVIPTGPDVPGVVQVFRNQGSATDGAWLGFVADEPIEVGASPTGIAVLDFDADGWPDIAIANGGDDTVTLLRNVGGLFGAEIETIDIAEFDEPAGIAAADFTLDGRVDLVVSNRGNGTVVLLENTGASQFVGPSFSLRDVSGAGSGASALDPEDLDNDKDIDLVVMSSDDDRATVIINGGFGFNAQRGGDVFVASFTVPVGDDPVDVVVADLDGNGLADFATANRGAGTISVRLNQGGFVFAPFPAIPVGSQPRSIDAADFDGDGDLDFVVAATDAIAGPAVQAIESFSASGGGLAFALPVAYDVGADPNFVIAADLDGDGLPDVVSVNTDDGPSGGSITALLSRLIVLPCPADLNDDGWVDVFDLLEVIFAFGDCPKEGECPADLNGDGVVDSLDLHVVIESFGPCPGTPCEGDLNGDGIVDVEDLHILVQSFGLCPPDGACPADLNGDGIVNAFDLLRLVRAFGPCGG